MIGITEEDAAAAENLGQAMREWAAGLDKTITTVAPQLAAAMPELSALQTLLQAIAHNLDISIDEMRAPTSAVVDRALVILTAHLGSKE